MEGQLINVEKLLLRACP